MKKIMGLLILVAIFVMLISSVNAADLQEHDFDGHFTLDVPDSYWGHDMNTEGYKYYNDQGINVEYITIEDINGASFEEYINSIGLENGMADGNFTIFQDGNKYVVVTKSDDEMYIITDKDLDEAKAIAESADLEVASDDSTKDTSATKETSKSTGDLEKVTVNDYLTIEAPKGTEFDNGTFDGYWTTYYGSEFDGIVYYTNGDLVGTTIDDAYYDEFINNITSHDGINSYEEGDVTIVEGIQNIDGTNAGYVHGDNAMVIVISNDLNLVKEMAKTVEFSK